MTTVRHWQFNNGVDPVNPGSPFSMVLPRCWTCWVYPDDDLLFEQWMITHCPTADFTHRFNGGNPMWTVTITDDGEASLFTLKFL